MSILRPGDEQFHYSDGSHKWIPPNPDYDQEVTGSIPVSPTARNPSSTACYPLFG
jgi:hypothetical protein